MVCKILGGGIALMGLFWLVMPTLGYRGGMENWISGFGSITPILLKVLMIAFGLLVVKVGCDKTMPRHSLARK